MQLFGLMLLITAVFCQPQYLEQILGEDLCELHLFNRHHLQWTSDLDWIN